MKKLFLVHEHVLICNRTNYPFAQTGITGSAHDFSGQGWGTTEICEPCHTPHNADASIAECTIVES